jgi:hypothetical protein
LADLPEASGIAPGRRDSRLLWVHNDSDGPFVLGVDFDGRLRARVRVMGAEVEDWEDIATGPCPAGDCLYIADIGDNDAERPRITIYRIPEPGAGESETGPAEAFHAVYADGPHDAESLFVTPDGHIIVATKGSPTAFYQFPRLLATGAVSVLPRLLVLEEEQETRGKKARRASRLTGGSVSQDGRWMAMRSNGVLRFFRSSEILAGRSGPGVVVDLAPLDEPQGEGVAFGAGETVHLVSEGGGKGRPGTLISLACRLPIEPTF